MDLLVYKLRVRLLQEVPDEVAQDISDTVNMVLHDYIRRLENELQETGFSIAYPDGLPALKITLD